MKVLAAIMAISAVVIAVLAAPLSQAAPAQFSALDRTLLAEYRVLDRHQVPVIIAVSPEAMAASVRSLLDRGVRVVGQRDDIGYLYVQVPIEGLDAILALPGLEALQIPTQPMRSLLGISSESNAAKSVALEENRPASPTPSLLADNPFTGESATQAATFKKDHPTFDGRGVLLAFVESMPPNVSSMRGALDLAGKPVPKVPDYHLGAPVAVGDAVAEGIYFWQRTEPVTADAQGVVIWRDRTYQLPPQLKSQRPGALQLRMCRRLPVQYGGGKEQYDVLWAVEQSQVWVLPASAGSDFSKALFASLTGSAPWAALGSRTDSSGGHSTPYAAMLSVDRQQFRLGLRFAGSGHAIMVGSVMAGANFLGSQAGGVAPAAQIAIFDASSAPEFPQYSAIENILGMLSDPAVDVAQSSWFVGDTSRFGGVSPYQLWADRLIRRSGKPFAQAAGNYGTALFGTMGFVMGEEVFAVGAYTPRETWQANLGLTPSADHTLAPYSGYGPSKDGGLKPDFLALTQTLSEGKDSWYWSPPAGFEQYGVSGGTSASGPNGAGHLALLVSAAKQSSIPYDARRLRAAIATTAKFLDGIEARAQGHGLIQVGDAWAALQRAQHWTPATFVTVAPLVGPETTSKGPQHATGRGLFEMSGWRPGETGQREIIVTRTGGGRNNDRYRLRWKGDTGVFSSQQRELELPLGKAVPIKVRIEVGASGSYSAIADLIDESNDLVAGSILLTVMVADPLPADGSALQYRTHTPRPGNKIFYVDVPEGLSALTVELRKGDGHTTWSAQDPTGRYLPVGGYGTELAVPGPLSDPSKTQRHFYADPVPGVWQFTMRAPEPHSRAELEAVADWSQPMALEVEMRGWKAQDGTASALSASNGLTEVRFRNPSGQQGLKIQPVGLGAARTTQISLQSGLKAAIMEVLVPPGSSELEVQLEGIPTSARVGLYVYKVPEDERRRKTTLGAVTDDTALIHQDPSSQPRKRYVLKAPPPGRYRVAVDPISVPDGGVKVVYRDTVYHSVFGSAEVKEVTGVVAGADPSAQVAIDVRARPSDGRELVATVGLFDTLASPPLPAIATQTWSATH